MENYKLKMELIDDEGRVVSSVIIDCSQIKTLDKSFGINALDEVYNVLLNDANIIL